MVISYLLLGGNLGDRPANLAAARTAIGAVCGPITAVSSLYETEAWGVSGQPSYLNQALAVRTELAPGDLLDAILSIEQTLGRERVETYGPRTIDIDILLYGDRVIDSPGLAVPHPQMPRRRFALTCLNEIAPHLIHPLSGKSIAQLLDECDDGLDVHKF
ncbi:MAG: 2-amino-4-hydroxy-6-hydroxymethyldihydropteridine pyrophosphokinae [Flaviaesturariibacter sp.]|nr:2-amino-4-hydroxy-6-hydroxymethyldihydropteridine pyrophosphokinae [Flaviaesturariibacter sp.]